MAASLRTRVTRRATRKDAAIRAALAEGDHYTAFNEAVRALRSEARKLRGWRPADAALIDSELAATLFAIAVELHARKPRREPGWPPVPQPEHLIAAYESGLKRAAEEAQTSG